MTCTIIDFLENFHPARLLIFQKIFPLHYYFVLFCPARLMFSKNFPTCTFIWSYTSIRYTRVSGFSDCRKKIIFFCNLWKLRRISEQTLGRSSSVTFARLNSTYWQTTYTAKIYDVIKVAWITNVSSDILDNN